MHKEELEQKVLSKVLSYLAYRARSSGEISQRLDRYLRSEKNLKDEDRKYIERRILTYLEENKLINDVDFSKLYIESKIKGKGALGRKALEYRLLAKGISKDIVEMSLSHPMSGQGELAVAIGLLSKKYKFSSIKPSTGELLKMRKYLFSKGFSCEISRQAVDYLLKRP
jgi:SOS response regulatory protein OraA/RecX